MKKQLKFTQNTLETIKRTIGIIGVVMITMLSSNSIHAQTNPTATATVADQELTVKGIISDEDGGLEGVSVVKKGTITGTATNKDGEFTFPKTLKTGDILLFSYLGYEEQEITIDKNTTDIKLILTTDVIEVMGALQTDKPYKSKRSK